MINGRYKQFYDSLKHIIPSERMLHDDLSLLAFGTDASFYRLLPKLVIKAYNENEVQAIFRSASRFNIPITFRAAGTSLSGQGISDSVLVVTSHGWESHEILNDGKQIRLQAGVRGFRANGWLNKYGRKIGPDPASIDSAMIAGIVSNNASGMSCGTVSNSYRTIADARIIFPDGSLLDTADEKSVSDFKKSHKEFISSLENISKRINDNPELREFIAKKYKIKNTTGYGINSYIDFSDGIDIIKHLIVGAEGTLAFISNVTFNTIIDLPEKALALIVFPSIKTACEAVQILRNQPVSAVELLDRQSIKSVENAQGIPPFLKTLSPGRCALLVETQAANKKSIEKQTLSICESIKEISTEFPFSFTSDPFMQASYWKLRKEALPTVAGMRRSGTTAIIEDVCFPVERLAEATMDLREILEDNGYSDAGIFGHSLAGNLHFMFNQDFRTDSELKRYSKFMDDIADLVVNKYGSSLKAEHGTGRNMAPFVKKEWGEEGYSIMKQTKLLFDPQGILNPGVLLNDDPLIHISNLKPTPSIRENADKCMECGFCEGTCVAEGLTLSPRQRVAVFREIEGLKASGREPHRAAELQKRFKYYALDTCATDSLCAMKCPVKVDTGKLVKELRHESNSPQGNKTAMFLATHLSGVTSIGRTGLNFLFFLRNILGKKLFGAIAKGMRSISFGAIPLWSEPFPKGAHHIDSEHSSADSSPEAFNVVYFPSCITRTMGVAKSYCREVEITELTKRLLTKAGCNIIYPENLDKLCCGMAFSSKGFVEAGKKVSDELQSALIQASQGGKYPILCDMSPCLYTMHVNMENTPLHLYEPAEFIQKFLLPRLKITPIDEKVAIFAVCSAKKLAVDATLVDIARKCAKEVVTVQSNCCGFAGDRGFILPELNAHGLRYLKEQVYGCDSGYATSRTCEIGLSYHSGIEFKSILYLVDKCSERA
jgi:D-lactate dehydrogenase